jgi:WD40 repeat protein
MGGPRAPPVGNALGDLEVEAVAPHHKKTGSDWYAIFNPAVQRVLDVDLVHSLTHESVVCCVRFSHDGKYVATGCNRSAQIFDVQTGEKVCVLEDHNAQDMTADLYIRSVCFSPDGRFLATGAEDKLIRVSLINPPRNKYTTVALGRQWDGGTNDYPLFPLRFGTLRLELFATISQDMSRTFTHLISPVTAELLHPVVAIAPFDCGISNKARTRLL